MEGGLPASAGRPPFLLLPGDDPAPPFSSHPRYAVKPLPDIEAADVSDRRQYRRQARTYAVTCFRSLRFGSHAFFCLLFLRVPRFDSYRGGLSPCSLM